jgi:glycosyltransferase involved in cell wall biosynthesis
MLVLHHGNFSGINESVIDAWRRAAVCDVAVVDLAPLSLASWTRKAEAAAVALRTNGAGLLRRGYGGLRGAIKRTAWYAEELEQVVNRTVRTRDVDFTLSMQTIIPVRRPAKPNFVFTDQTILCNLQYPDGAEAAGRWQEYQPYERDTIRAAAAVFAMSQSSRHTLLESYGLPQERAFCVGGGPVAVAPAGAEAGRYARGNILFVGLDWERKGGPELVEAFPEVRRVVPSATLTIVGCSPRVSQDGVEIVGPVPASHVGHYLNRASVFCMPSRREPFGLVYIEAMHAGLPVVALRQGAVRDFVIDGETGFLVDAGGPALADRLVDLLRDAHRCEQMGAAARRLVESRYTWESTQRLMWNVIQKRLS